MNLALRWPATPPIWKKGECLQVYNVWEGEVVDKDEISS
jgi:hypothetical protein